MKFRVAVIAGIFIFLVTVSVAMAEVQVTAQVDRTSVAPGESLRLRVSIKGGDGDVDLSAMEDFKVLSRGTGSNFQVVNGKMTREFMYNYMLLPQGQGKLTIPALAVEVAGRRYLTAPITITVTKPTDEAETEAKRDVWITAEISDTAPVLGQQITYTFRFFRAVQTDNIRFQPPNFHGFRAKDVEDQHAFSKIINGREYAVTEVYYILTPIEPGQHSIEPAMLQLGIIRQDNRRSMSPFDSIFGRRSREQRVLQTEAIDLAVVQLPDWQGDPPFSGLVGRFDLTATMESTDLRVGDSATLAISLKGRGNLMDARTPELQLPSTVKHYADNPEDDIQLGPFGYSGQKIFRTAIVPVTEGEIQIDPIRMVYFDVEENRYRTLTAAVPKLSVAKADGTTDVEVAVSGNPLTLAKQRVAFTGRDILPPKDSLTAVSSRAPFSGWIFLLAMAIPAVTYAGAVLAQQLRRQEKTPTAIMKARARQALKQAGRQTGPARLGHLYQALTAAILAAVGRTGEALTWKEAENILLQQGRAQHEAREAAALLSKIETYKFGDARIDDAEEANLLDQTRKMIRTLAS